MIVAKLQSDYVTLFIATKECDPALKLPPSFRLGSLRALKLEDDNDFMKMLYDHNIQYSKDIATDLDNTNLFLQRLLPEMRLYVIGKVVSKKSPELGDWFKAGAIGERPEYDLKDKKEKKKEKRRADEEDVSASIDSVRLPKMPRSEGARTVVDADVLSALAAIAQTVNDINRMMVCLVNEIRALSYTVKDNTGDQGNPMAPGPPADTH